MPETAVENILEGSKLKVSAICSNKAGGVYLGGFNGNIYNYNTSKLDSLYTDGIKLIETIYFDEVQQKLLFPQQNLISLDLNTNKTESLLTGAIKDITRIDANNFAVATNVSAASYSRGADGEFELKELYRGRTNGLCI